MARPASPSMAEISSHVLSAVMLGLEGSCSDAVLPSGAPASPVLLLLPWLPDLPCM